MIYARLLLSHAHQVSITASNVFIIHILSRGVSLPIIANIPKENILINTPMFSKDLTTDSFNNFSFITFIIYTEKNQNYFIFAFFNLSNKAANPVFNTICSLVVASVCAACCAFTSAVCVCRFLVVVAAI